MNYQKGYFNRKWLQLLISLPLSAAYHHLVLRIIDFDVFL
jgi:hypothetical protein